MFPAMSEHATRTAPRRRRTCHGEEVEVREGGLQRRRPWLIGQADAPPAMDALDLLAFDGCFAGNAIFI
jgi:hypothetical protein